MISCIYYSLCTKVALLCNMCITQDSNCKNRTKLKKAPITFWDFSEIFGLSPLCDM